ncbi:hypothetical protein ACEWY4_006339 [Coilia grayii]|uniref:LRAT domain-containing protein n=1 Tax=Coilia grayii TaxID=363190 RepID=A0ABD1KD65_9TELE
MAGSEAGTPAPNPGDMVEFIRPKGYSHFGICVGNGQVVHLSKDKPQMGIKSTIQKEYLEKVAAGDSYRVNNQDDKKSPIPPEEIVKKANAMVGEKMLWTPFHNCETVASEMRYGDGKGHSEQTLKATDWGQDFTHNVLNPGF